MFERHEELELGFWFVFFFYPVMDINYSFLFTLELKFQEAILEDNLVKEKQCKNQQKLSHIRKNKLHFFSAHPYFFQALFHLSDE